MKYSTQVDGAGQAAGLERGVVDADVQDRVATGIVAFASYSYLIVDETELQMNCDLGLNILLSIVSL